MKFAASRCSGWKGSEKDYLEFDDVEGQYVTGALSENERAPWPRQL